MTQRPIRRALVSVSDKSGLATLAAALLERAVEVVSTGSTAARLTALGVDVVPVSELTGFPECLDGRVKTLHPAVHAGLLADLRNPEHERQLAELGIAPFDLLVANLYPFRETAGRADASAAEILEQIDVGGPAMMRAAAKNHANVAVVVDPGRYAEVASAVREGGFTLEERRALAAAAFAHTAGYDAMIANWMYRSEEFPPYRPLVLERAGPLRYGENPHQRAARYLDPDAPAGVASAEQLHGKALSFNNYVDADAAHRAANDFAEPCAVIVKHTNPCGIALGFDVAAAYGKALAGDPVSAYGGVVATNRPVSVALAARVAEVFTEVLVAPGYDDAALELLARKASIRLLVAPAGAGGPRTELHPVTGGMLAQTTDRIDAPGDRPASWTLAAGDAADQATLAELAFAWRAVRSVKSNAILLATDRASVGVGMGQVNRVDAARLAVYRAGDRARGAVAASDAFFPYADGLQVLAAAGVRAVVAPGGSVRDEEVVAAARAAGLTLYLTGARHFWH